MILAMWSGPRNLSTAMMRSFANRRDVMNVMDEPLYASYLFRSPKRHPMHEEILKSQPTSYKEAINNCLIESPGISFQKHMVQHVNFDESNDWMSSLLVGIIFQSLKHQCLYGPLYQKNIKKWVL